MLKTFALKAWAHRQEFTKYFVIGLIGFVTDLGSLYVLKEYFGFRPVFAVITNQPFILFGIFYLNKRWSFRAGGLTHRQFIKFAILAGINYVIGATWIYVFHDKFGVHYLLARVSNIILAVSWNFLLYKYWVYKFDKMPEIGQVQ